MSRNISITENDDGTATIQIKPEYVEYNFDSFGDAVAALCDLPEITT